MVIIYYINLYSANEDVLVYMHVHRYSRIISLAPNESRNIVLLKYDS